LALTAETLLDSVVLIALDWEKPSQFVEELQSRLAEVQACVQEIEKQKGNAWIVQEGRDSGELCPMPCLRQTMLMSIWVTQSRIISELMSSRL
jgi:hypothetical protein